MSLSFDIDKSKMVDSDQKEFIQDSVSGFKLYIAKCKDQAFAKDFISDVVLAGHSSNGKESCGQWKFIGCLEHGLHKTGCVYCRKVEFHCNSKGCNKCFESTIKREAMAITNRLMTFCNLKKNRRIYLKEQNRVRILSHVTVSAPHDVHHLALTKEGRKKLRQTQIKILKRLDVDGGVTISHPYRFTDGIESAYLSVHYHNIITGWIDGGIVKEIYNQTGWIVKQISTIETEKDCYNLSKYLLSHSGVFEKEVGKRSSEHSVSYFGECQNRMFKVNEVLKNSVTGYDQLDSILFSRKEITRKGESYSIQKICYTHSMINGSIKESTNEYFESTSVMELSKSLRAYITPKKDMTLDNPALSQSEPFEFIQLRFDYGISPTSIVQSEYVNIVFDTSLDELCPECSLKMQTLVPPDDWSIQQKTQFQDIFKSIPENCTQAWDNSMGLRYLFEVKVSLLGIPYFDQDGTMQHETGIYSRPSCLDGLNTKLYWSIIKNTEIQRVRYEYKKQNGRMPNSEELEEITQTVKIKPIISHKINEF